MNRDLTFTFDHQGAPFSNQFDDIYFDTTNGCQQSDEVFIKTNQIEQRLANHQGTFTIAETGFGTGLNFLLTLHYYQQAIHANPELSCQLHFISVEKFPLTKQQLAKSLALLPELKTDADKLINRYPDEPSSIFTTNFYQDRVKLTICFDDATKALTSLDAEYRNKVNAWFLDGFAPAKNPEMWSAELFNQMARLSAPQATLATFTVAGMVRRGLMAAGFRVKKQPSQGKKSEVLFGQYQFDLTTIQGFKLRPQIAKPQHVAIIGGGIASACAAFALAKQGIKITVYCQDEQLAQGASSNAIGAIYPLVHQQKDEISRFFEQAFWHAKDCYQTLADNGYDFDHQWCGLLELSYKEALVKRQEHFADSTVWPEQLVHSVSSTQASDLAKIPLANGGLFFPAAGWVAPKQLVSQLFAAAKACGQVKIKLNSAISAINQQQDGCWLLTSKKSSYKASVVVLCGGAAGMKLTPNSPLPLYPVKGQITVMAPSATSASLSTVLCHKGYVTPTNNNQQCIGATFDKTFDDIEPTTEADRFNLTTATSHVPALAQWQDNDIIGHNAQLRNMTADHLPVVGAMPDIDAHIATYPHLAKDKHWHYTTSTPVVKNFYLLTGLGARGLCTAPLLADILAADLCNLPYPVDSEMLFNLSPNRFVIRDIIKRKV